MFGWNFSDYLQSRVRRSLTFINSWRNLDCTLLCNVVWVKGFMCFIEILQQWLIKGSFEERKGQINRMRSVSTAFIANMLERRSNQPYMLVEYGLLLGASVLNCFFIHRLITIGWGAAERGKYIFEIPLENPPNPELFYQEPTTMCYFFKSIHTTCSIEHLASEN